MAVGYKKLWKLFIGKDMERKDLCAKAGISPASVTGMGRNGRAAEICMALGYRTDGIAEIVSEGKEGA